jgi:hypothetical protein
MPGIFERVRLNKVRRCNDRNEVSGRYFEQLLGIN